MAGLTDGAGSGPGGDALLYNMDYAPTICDLLGLPIPEKWQGQSFANALRGLPEPMQTTLQNGPALYNDPVLYMAHLRRTGREHLADDLHQRLNPGTGAVAVSWQAPVDPDNSGRINGPATTQILPDTGAHLFGGPRTANAHAGAGGSISAAV